VRGTLHGSTHCVSVVFDNEYYGEFPEHCKVHGFVECALPHSAVAHVANAECAGLPVFFGERDSGTERDLSPYDSVATKEIVFLIKYVHGTALALGDPRRFAIEFGHDELRVCAQRHRMRVVAIGGYPLVVLLQRGSRAGRAGFLADIQVAEAADFLLSVQLTG